MSSLNQHQANKRPYATSTKRRSVTITELDWKALRKLGNGNASAGIREAIRKATKPS